MQQVAAQISSLSGATLLHKAQLFPPQKVRVFCVLFLFEVPHLLLFCSPVVRTSYHRKK
jgi:hypothetical protein